MITTIGLLASQGFKGSANLKYKGWLVYRSSWLIPCFFSLLPILSTFRLPYELAEMLVGILIIIYFTFAGFSGLFTVLIISITGPVVRVDILGNDSALILCKYPALLSVTAAFVSIWFSSMIDRSANAAHYQSRFEHQYIGSQTGIGAHWASEH